MSTFGWHPRSHRDALEGMRKLTLEERGAYNTLLDLIYERGAPVPDDARWLSGWMNCSLRKWASLREGLIESGKIYAINVNAEPCLMNVRAALEIENQTKLTRNLSESGAKGGRKRAENASGININSNLEQAPLEAALKLKTETETIAEEANASLSSPDDAPRLQKYPEPFELVWKAYPHTKGRSSKPKSLGYWRRLPAPDRERLPQAIARYAREGREPKADCGAPAFDRWLKDARYLDWLETARIVAPVAEPAVQMSRARHFRDTGEWKPSWGDKPDLEQVA
jgi:uncharacterized protein YdaU (DUF1376 family)